MNKDLFFIFLNIYSLLIFSAYSTPILLLPSLATERSVNSICLAIIFSAFPMGAFPASILIGKLMRFHRKDKLLLVFNVISCCSRFSMGLLYYIEDPTWFFILGTVARFITGLAEGALIPITYSFIPDLFPDDMMVKFGILEIWGSVGTIMGAPLSSLIYEQLGYFPVFAIMSSANLIIGMFIIIVFLKSDSILSFKKAEKDSLPLKDALFNKKSILLNFFYLFIFFFPNFMIQTGYQNYMETLTSSLYISAAIYSLILVGMIVGVYIIKKCYSQKYERKIMFFFGLLIIIALTFYGPDPIYGITDNTLEIIIIGISFFVVGIAIEVIFLIITKILINELLDVFPGEKELCADFANGMFVASFTLDQFLGPYFGSFVNEYMGYERTGTFFAMMISVYFCLYWNLTGKTREYNTMVEEAENIPNKEKEVKEQL